MAVVLAVSLVAVGAIVAWVADLGASRGSPNADGADEPDGVSANGASGPLPSCAEARHLVVFDIFHMLTPGNVEEHELVSWIQDPTDEPDVLPGAVELVQLYRELGYEILYVHAAPDTIVINGQPLAAAIQEWLERQGFPVDDGVPYWSWTPTSEADDFNTTPLTVMTDALAQLGVEQVDVRFGYSGITGRAEAFIAGGVSPDRVFTLGEAATVAGTTVIPGGDLNAHVSLVRATADAVCTPR